MSAREFVVATRRQEEWGWRVILGLFFSGTGAGSFFIALILGAVERMAVGVGLVLLGGCFLLWDLSRPLKAWRVLWRPQSSWISRGILGILSFVVLGLAHIAALATQPQGWTSLGAPWATGPTWAIVLGLVAGVAALFVASYPGFLLAGMRPVALWNSAYIPVLFLISSLLSGLGDTYLLPLKWGDSAKGLPVFLQNFSLGLVILGFLIFLSLILLVYPEGARESVRLLSRGSLKIHFYGGVLGLGLIVPLVFLAFVFLGSAPTFLLYLSGLLLLLGMLLLRYIIVKAGIQVSPV